MIEVKDKAKIKTKEFEFNLQDEAKIKQFVESFDYLPFLYLSKSDSGTTINPREIIYVKLYNNKFLPEIELSCYDSTGVFFTTLYPFDHDAILSIFVKSSSNLNFPIRMDFRVTEFETIKSSAPNERQTLKYLIRGILDVDSLQYTRYEVRKGTSHKIIRDIALEMDLGFATNIEDSNDEMKWINPSETYIDFIKDTTKRAYVKEDSFVWTFIDFYYNLNYVNIETELNLNQEEQQTLTPSRDIKDAEEQLVDLYLTNNPAFNMTNKFIEKFDLINQSYKVNLEKAYRMKSTWYEKNENKIYRNFLDDIETNDPNLRPLYDYNAQIYTENVNDDYYIGKVESDNVHRNYAITKAINLFNLQNIEKMRMIIILPQINFDIKRFQNVRVEIYNIRDMFSQKSGPPSTGGELPVDNINETLSGFWFVTGINYLYRRSGGVQQEVTLIRRDLNISYKDRYDFRKIIKK